MGLKIKNDVLKSIKGVLKEREQDFL